MIKKGAFRGSVYELTNDQLRQLCTAANYRGLNAVVRCIRQEQTRRLQAADTSTTMLAA